MLSLLFFVEPDPPVLAVSAISLILSSVASFLGSHLWMKREESVEVSFSDLMLWSWWRRQRAEERLARGAELLGLDASGHPVADQPVIGREQRLKVLHELSGALESKDPYTHGHSQRVERHSFRIGAALGLSVTDLEDLRLAAALHDVGKIRVSDRILRKPGKLTPEEYKEIQDHSVVGAWMVSSVGNPDVISAVRHHHERFDGAGYPDGISGHDIPLFARIIGVADSYDAITSSRPYRARSERERAIRILKEESGKQFDPMVVDAFLSSLPAAAPVTAALAFLLPGPIKVVRKAATVMKEMGGAGIAETVRAAGVTMVLSASVAAPVAQYVAPDRPRSVQEVRAQKEVPLAALAPAEASARASGSDGEPAAAVKGTGRPSASVESGGSDDGFALAGEVADPLDTAIDPLGDPSVDPGVSAELPTADGVDISADVDVPESGGSVDRTDPSSGNGNSGTGKPDHGKGNSDTEKPDKPEKPEKPDKPDDNEGTADPGNSDSEDPGSGGSGTDSDKPGGGKDEKDDKDVDPPESEPATDPEGNSGGDGNSGEGGNAGNGGGKPKDRRSI